MEPKIQLRHPEGKKAISISKEKYDLLKKMLIAYLKKNGSSTHTEIWQAAAADLAKNKIRFEGSVQWYMEWVKLDLEANHIIERLAGTSPQQYALSK